MNTAECTFEIEVIDVQDPIIGCPQDVTISTDAGVCEWASQAGSLSPIVAIENCEPNLQWSVENPDGSTAADSGDVSGYVFELGESVVTYTLSDSSGVQLAACNFRVTVEDNESPEIAGCNDLGLYFFGSAEISADDGLCSATPTLPPVIVTDNCSSELEADLIITRSDGLIVTETLTQLVVFGTPTPFYFSSPELLVGVNTIEVVVRDESGNESRCIGQIVVTDDEEPTITCSVLDPAYNTDLGSCDYTVQGDEFDPMVGDNCTVESVSNDYNATSSLANAVFPVGSTTVVWTVTDESGNTATCEITVVVEDNETPVFVNCPGDTITVGNDFSNCQGGVNWSIPIATDNCEVSVTQTAGPTPGDILDVGNYTVTYIATDGNMNTAECTFAIEVIDVQDPIIGCPQDVTISTDADVCEWASQAGSLSPIVAIENCEPNLQWSVENPDGSIDADSGDVSGYVFELGESVVTYTLSDSSGVQLAACNFRVTVEDNESPEIAGCNDLGLYFFGSAEISADDGLCSATPTLPPVIVTDNCSSELEADLIITRSDGLIVTETLTQLVVFGTPTPFYFSSPELLVGVNTIEVVVRDESGNESRCIGQIVVTDDEEPTITCSVLDPAYNTDLGSCDYTVQGDEFDPMVGDNCTVESVSNDYNATSSLAKAVFPVGSTTVVWTVTDESGNTATCEITVVVEDNETPVFVNCPVGPITVGNDFSNCEGGVNWSVPIATDNCEVSVAQTAGPTAGDILDVGNYTVTYIATDDAGNTAECTFEIEVLDVQDPIIGCPQDVTISTDADVCEWASQAGSLSPIVAIENCEPNLQWSVENPDGSTAADSGDVSGYVFGLGVSTVTYTLTDSSGVQLDECSFNVTVEDTEAPVITCPADEVLSASVGDCFLTLSPELTDVEASDNCTVFGDLDIS